MKRICLCLIMITFLLNNHIKGQEAITITQCYELARANYPQIKQYGLIGQTEQYNLSNAAKGWLPQVAINAKASYQSDVTKLPFDSDMLSALIPRFTIPTLSKDQYQVTAEVSQTIWDGGIIQSSRELSRAQATAEREQLESDLYPLIDRVNQLYFGCLLQDELLLQNATLQKELQVNIDKIKAMIDNGIANQSDLESMQVELLNTRQREIELKASRTAYGQMLGVLINETPPLLAPPPNPLKGGLTAASHITPPSGGWGVERPELRALDAKNHLLDVQNKQITAGLMPRLGLFVQGGYGRPGLNMLKDSFEPFYIAGVRLSWNIGKFYTLNNDRRRIEINRQAIDMQRETFLFNTSLQVVQQNTEIQKMNELLNTDYEIVRLRESIKKAAEVKLENGVISVTDLIREIHAEDMAKQTAATHRIQQLMAIYNYMYTTNNQ
ncbi:outer membrane protein TolC [Parabacteroides sp. PF5-5]|uniref:TolC family protein n=1 Tax=unclassified Parabacteroides TaxID=2649774 RepID=UPI0024747820|nr:MULTISPECIES: TolC family protein [unclassified Parabacteroides]MDH6305849.1 outer membrane protein TolC [Parabacteroides sp. PH5-39]MDH6317337.1 outer membrane protein TolC [Parabacteroides sp. PF5-13]MDH6320545.1 outer membrane protein TolC [Parabacteroides sp. PH5-13]MDH6324292.1 outer membrane protein TolC [Parabacteroides sp. PH5-8]MDH6328489.1 outer membrane protein TolC [Parabacteroides sp. PH5-41]